jgi:hypothetical protein
MARQAGFTGSVESPRSKSRRTMKQHYDQCGLLLSKN